MYRFLAVSFGGDFHSIILTNFKQECDLGQQSILHAVRTRLQPMSKSSLNISPHSWIAEENEEIDNTTKPLAKTLSNLVFSDSTSENDCKADTGNDDVDKKKNKRYPIVIIF